MKGWKLNVKTRLFVTTLQDHFNERVQEEPKSPTNPSDKLANTDDWAAQFISLAWLQPITEVFDENRSGYISITELNRFTDSIPEDLEWRSTYCYHLLLQELLTVLLDSLKHWIAYWTVGNEL